MGSQEDLEAMILPRDDQRDTTLHKGAESGTLVLCEFTPSYCYIGLLLYCVVICNKLTTQAHSLVVIGVSPVLGSV